MALAAIALSAILLIAPAAHHRIVFGGEDAEEFLPIASCYFAECHCSPGTGHGGRLLRDCREGTKVANLWDHLSRHDSGGLSQPVVR